jgi:hypothetical protein
MSTKNFSVPLVCLFCGSLLEGKTDAEYASGDLIKCLHCGEENDYDSLISVAKEKGLKQAKKMVQVEIKRTFKDIFKK